MERVLRAEVAVVGGGPAATATAITLRRAGVDVVVIAGRLPRERRYRPGEGGPPGVDRTVQQVFGGEFHAFEPREHLRSYGNRSAWGSDELVTTDFMFNPFGSGWHLDRDEFDARLLGAVERAGVRVLHDAEVVTSVHDDGWRLTVRSGAGAFTVAARLVCDASGRRAVVARAHGAVLERDDRLTGLASVQSTEEHEPFTTVAAAESGWWYRAPLPGGRQVVAFFSDPDLVDLVEMKQAMEQPVLLAAGAARLASPVGDGWLAVGDAAASFDPISSQGILTALLMGREAGRAAAQLLGGGTASDYAATYQRVVDRYRLEHRRCYAAEGRWPDSPFWARRRSSAGQSSRRSSDRNRLALRT